MLREQDSNLRPSAYEAATLPTAPSRTSEGYRISLSRLAHLTAGPPCPMTANPEPCVNQDSNLDLSPV